MTLSIHPYVGLRALSAAAVAAILLQVFYLDLSPLGSRVLDLTWDKLVHFGTFAILAGLLLIACGGRWALAIVAVVGLLGLADEMRQLHVPGRDFDLADNLADLAGAAVALLVLETKPGD